MRKFHGLLDPNHPDRITRSRAPVVFALIVFVLVAPLAYEGGQLLLGSWMSLVGAHREAETPLLNSIAEWSRDASVGARRYYSGVMNGGSWHPSTAVPLAITWAALMAVVFLRRTS